MYPIEGLILEPVYVYPIEGLILEPMYPIAGGREDQWSIWIERARLSAATQAEQRQTERSSAATAAATRLP